MNIECFIAANILHGNHNTIKKTATLAIIFVMPVVSESNDSSVTWCTYTASMVVSSNLCNNLEISVKEIL